MYSAIETKNETRNLLKDQAYSILKQGIIRGLNSPGSFLSERKLVAQLGMSKTAIRAALELLEAEGFVTVSPQQGIIVREPSLREIADQFEIRLVLESYVLRRISGSLSKDQIVEINRNLEQQRQAAETSDLETAVRLDGEFHHLFCEFLNNREIVETMKRLREKISWIIGLAFRQDRVERIRPNWKEHQGIAEAVINSETEKAVSLLAEHFEYGKRALLGIR